MVRALHEAGIEVILDVVYNHTAEGNHLGPTLSMRGIDNAAYYRLVDDDKRYYMDYTGTGNSLNVRHPHSLQLIMDSLRYWVTEMHVDGFRFDLASTLAREFYDVDRLSTFFELVQQDPTVSQVKLIAEPWDVGPGGYQVGNFPPQWTEWNGKYRDTVRDFWRGEPATLGEFASRLTGSADLYEHTARRPVASINFVTAHDGFTLRDLVSYNEKHNEANGEDNNDGESHNRSWNCGVEGPTDDPEIIALRARQQRNFLTTLLLSQGVPMICHGDELGRTQQRQQQRLLPGQRAHLDRLGRRRRRTCSSSPASVVRAARRAPGLPPAAVLRRAAGAADAAGTDCPDIAWFAPDGSEMTDEDWDSGFGKSVGVFLNGQGIPDLDPRGERVTDDSFLLCFNAHHEAIDFTLPPKEFGAAWQPVIDTRTRRSGSRGGASRRPGTGPVRAGVVGLCGVADPGIGPRRRRVRRVDPRQRRRSHLWGGWLQAAPGPRFRVTGTAGTYILATGDTQEDHLVRATARHRPATRWGAEPAVPGDIFTTAAARRRADRTGPVERVLSGVRPRRPRRRPRAGRPERRRRHRAGPRRGPASALSGEVVEVTPMSDPDLATLLADEERLVFDHFDHQTAWDLGSAMRAQALVDRLPIVISIRRNGQRHVPHGAARLGRGQRLLDRPEIRRRRPLRPLLLLRRLQAPRRRRRLRHRRPP